MAGVIDTVGSSPGASSGVSTYPAATSAEQSSSASATVASPLRNPQVIQDPTAGFITQYIAMNGQIINQSPSAIVVAYLRQGLTAEGTPKNRDPFAATA
ncbi:MAG: hypothetical protein PHE27_04705 [Alphaproteobacteria bacterium]|nr:hypothetical protein [Alphaproteobacteria bacterium]